MKLDINYRNNKFKTDFFPFYFFINDFSLNIGSTSSSFYRFIGIIHIEGTMSQNFDLGLFIPKNRKILVIFS